MSGRVPIALALLAGLIVAVGATACGPSPASMPGASSAPAVTRLPSPNLEGPLSLEAAMHQRRSVRTFQDTPLTPAELGQLLWAAQGITHPRGFRTAPSAGALYPLELYVATAGGVYHYETQEHALRELSRRPALAALHEAALRQDAVRQAPAVIVVAAVYARTAEKYGAERSPRYVHLEAGHAAQNLLLEAVSLKLGAVPIGAFHEEEVQSALGLPSDHEPLYLIPVGHPADGDR